MNDRDAGLFAEAMTECTYSNKGCTRLPVRMVAERNVDSTDPANIDLIMLCKLHSPLYVASGKVIFDKPIIEDQKILDLL